MKNTFVQTKNAQALMAALAAVNERGAEEACLIVVDGAPGLGKSATIEHLATQLDSAFIRAKAEWRPSWFLNDLLDNLGIVPEHRFEAKFKQAINAIAQRLESALMQGEEFYIFIDEVDHIVGNKKILETIRDISDNLQVPVVLVGMGRVRTSLSRYPQVASRIGQFVEFKDATLDDAKQLVSGLSEVGVEDDLIAYLFKHSKGKYRELKEGIASIERFGKKQNGKAVSLKDMVGKVLMNDRATGQPIMVRV